MPTFYEFFAGGGMARAGLGRDWTCLFANDFDARKASTYVDNWGADHFVCQDIATLDARDLPGRADLAWASFPCQDLSLAGSGLGLGQGSSEATTRSGSFWAFRQLISDLKDQGRAPGLVVLENVVGTLTSRGGRDFSSLVGSLTTLDYRVGALVVDASLFVPQSRSRLFIIALSDQCPPNGSIARGTPCEKWHPARLVDAWRTLDGDVRNRWVWWTPPSPAVRTCELADLIEDQPVGVEWHSQDETHRLLGSMTSRNQDKVVAAQVTGSRQVGTAYRRTRVEAGVKRVRAEARFDGMAGCLRTPAGGSSRQTLLVVDGARVRSRLLSPREAARLMGLPEHYRLPARYSDAYHLAGDGVCVPVVRHLAEHLLEPLLSRSTIDPMTMAA